jgi:hypothetical protein
MVPVALAVPTEHLDDWRVLFGSSSPHLELLPSEWQDRLGPFQRLLLLRALRPDKLTQAINKYVADSMGRCGQPPVRAMSSRSCFYCYLRCSICRSCHLHKYPTGRRN